MRLIPRLFDGLYDVIDEGEILKRLRALSADRDEYLLRLRQAEHIAQVGGVDDEALRGLLHLAVAGQVTPSVERALRRVGIDVRSGVDPDWIKAQREAGWPDMHPEDYCHRCGARNPLWCAEREDWLTATSAWAAETGREGICCPACFAEMHRAATGRDVIWRITQTTAGTEAP